VISHDGASAGSRSTARRRIAEGTTLTAMQATAYTYDADTRSGSVLLDNGTPVPFDAPAFDAGGLRLLRPGQRVRIETEGEGEALKITLVTLQTL